MSWTSVLLLCAAAYALKLAGALGASRASDHAADTRLDALVVPVIAGLIAVQTVGGDQAIVSDARLPALAVAALLIWRRTPLLVVVIAAGGIAAGLRAVGYG